MQNQAAADCRIRVHRQHTRHLMHFTHVRASQLPRKASGAGHHRPLPLLQASCTTPHAEEASIRTHDGQAGQLGPLFWNATSQLVANQDKLQPTELQSGASNLTQSAQPVGRHSRASVRR